MHITYNPAADLKNWFRIKEQYPESFTITKFYPFDKGIQLKREKFNDIVKTINLQDITRFNTQASLLESEWKNIEQQVLATIFSYLGIAPLALDFKANLTTAYLMPYDERDDWFMVPTHKPLMEQLRCIVHELFHLYHFKQNSSSSQPERETEVQKFLKGLKLPKVE